MRKLYLLLVSMVLFMMFTVPEYAGAQGKPAEGFDSDDQIYIKAEEDYYWKGRYSNGRIFAEYIANELANDYDNITNYAVGGAFSGVMTGEKGTDSERTNWSEWLQGWGGVQQTEKFLEDVNGKADSKALYIISVGGNDAYAVEDLGEVRAAELASDYSLRMIKNLVENGAKYILLPNRFMDERSGLTSFEEMRNRQVGEKVQEYLTLESTPNDVKVIFGHNQQLSENIEAQGFEKFGYKSMGFYLISDWVPAYGYAFVADDNSDVFPTTEAEEIYGGYGVYSTDSKYYQPETKDWEPDDFYLYDEYHPTNRTQKHLATYLMDADIDTEEGTFEKVYDGEPSDFATAIADGVIPSEYSTVYTFGDSSIDSGRGLEVTTELVNQRQTSDDSNQAESTPSKSTHTVRSGDTLWAIAKTYYGNELTNTQIAMISEEIYKENSNEIKNPNLIYPNQVIHLPAKLVQ